jgi:hypothetical protein
VGEGYTHPGISDRFPCTTHSLRAVTGSLRRTVTVAAVVRAVLVGAVAVGAWASGVAALAPSCDAASLQGFDVIREPSLNPSARAYFSTWSR